MFDKQKKCFAFMMIIIVTIITGDCQTAFAGENEKTGTIKGKLLDKYTLRPISGAEVTIPGTTYITVTNPDR